MRVVSGRHVVDSMIATDTWQGVMNSVSRSPYYASSDHHVAAAAAAKAFTGNTVTTVARKTAAVARRTVAVGRHRLANRPRPRSVGSQPIRPAG